MSLITSRAAQKIRTIRTIAVAAARAVHYAQKGWAKIAPVVRAIAIISLLVIIAIAIITVDFLISENANQEPETFREATETLQEPEGFGEATKPLANLSVSALRKIAQSRNLRGARNARKSELLAMLE